MNPGCIVGLTLAFSLPITGSAQAQVFPYKLPTAKPGIPLSAAMERLYDNYDAPAYWWNELFSRFCYRASRGWTSTAATADQGRARHYLGALGTADGFTENLLKCKFVRRTKHGAVAEWDS